MQDAGFQLVGETAGGNPSGYGEVRSFLLPNSRLIVNYSTRKVTLPRVGDLLTPHVSREVNFADYMAEKDAFPEAALRP